jgi:hypothetical protein
MNNFLNIKYIYDSYSNSNLILLLACLIDLFAIFYNNNKYYFSIILLNSIMLIFLQIFQLYLEKFNNNDTVSNNLINIIVGLPILFMMISNVYTLKKISPDNLKDINDESSDDEENILDDEFQISKEYITKYDLSPEVTMHIQECVLCYKNNLSKKSRLSQEEIDEIDKIIINKLSSRDKRNLVRYLNKIILTKLS